MLQNTVLSASKSRLSSPNPQACSERINGVFGVGGGDEGRVGSDIEGTMARLDRDGLILGMTNSVVQTLSRCLGLHQET
ncbi:hypothetical protein [Ralstonia sp. UBA689]|uniref:hypothetical protein n=1 Tax=Ralstonia sp. UBA689 TaxID=1947373 RepID=UPI0025D8E417|nr:hypothetical protein [Ralstonia sp. UBA689]